MHGCYDPLHGLIRESRAEADGAREIPGLDMIGVSAAFRAVQRDISIVAPTDTTVFVRGETGTGKELIARAVHALSRRRLRPLITLNCAAISPALVECELFGHVRGAFTGAVDRREGRFELADRGTLILDEVSEMPLETQGKLLRVLQEREFERVGSSQTVKVDVRVIATSNRDLDVEVRQGRFRADLFYRLNVFPIVVPPLRERCEDILPLAEFFMQRMARKLGKPLHRIAPATAAALEAHRWPGNVRDLENTIERAAVLAHDGNLVMGWVLRHREHDPSDGCSVNPLPPAGTTACVAAQELTLLHVERRHIAAILNRTAGVIEGPKGAAHLLGLKPSTLRHRIRKLGIVRPSGPSSGERARKA